jgi:hypothetical protein
MEVSQMPLYEVLLLRDDETETRLTDHALEIGQSFPVGEEQWIVQSEAPSERTDAATRYICVRAPDTE